MRRCTTRRRLAALGAEDVPYAAGARQPTLAVRLTDPSTVWQEVKVAWYGGGRRRCELAMGTAVWYHRGLPPVAVRWALIRDPHGQRAP